MSSGCSTTLPGRAVGSHQGPWQPAGAVTLDERQLVQALEVAKPQETEVMRAYQRLAEVREELRRIEPMRVALSRAGAPETLRTSVEQVRTDLITLEGQLTAATGASG